MLSVAHIHQLTLIFGKNAAYEPGNQCPLATRLAPSTVRPVLFAVPRRELLDLKSTPLAG
jgi:hypothetical protein